MDDDVSIPAIIDALFSKIHIVYKDRVVACRAAYQNHLCDIFLGGQASEIADRDIEAHPLALFRGVNLGALDDNCVAWQVDAPSIFKRQMGGLRQHGKTHFA